MSEKRQVRCNRCGTFVYEEYLIKDEDTDSGERCPICKKSDALMDIPEYQGALGAYYIGIGPRPLEPANTGENPEGWAAVAEWEEERANRVESALEENDGAIQKAIADRDAAQEVIDRLLDLIGVQNEWSNLFGYHEALEAAEAAIDNMKAETAKAYALYEGEVEKIARAAEQAREINQQLRAINQLFSSKKEGPAAIACANCTRPRTDCDPCGPPAWESFMPEAAVGPAEMEKIKSEQKKPVEFAAADPSFIPEGLEHEIRCNYTECDWGQGLGGMGRCSGYGNPRDANCPRFTTEAGEYIPEGFEA